uniref:Uncharacterized protein n=1 Tax=Nelumbo nucifera TaxID=4432 RepID=A0A822YE89_NELNU|nr:TPA_asm: hypothetical protein HUJ06_009563 [Nelumbo nucifera]
MALKPDSLICFRHSIQGCSDEYQKFFQVKKRPKKRKRKKKKSFCCGFIYPSSSLSIVGR